MGVLAVADVVVAAIALLLAGCEALLYARTAKVEHLSAVAAALVASAYAALQAVHLELPAGELGTRIGTAQVGLALLALHQVLWWVELRGDVRVSRRGRWALRALAAVAFPLLVGGWVLSASARVVHLVLATTPIVYPNIGPAFAPVIGVYLVLAVWSGVALVRTRRTRDAFVIGYLVWVGTAVHDVAVFAGVPSVGFLMEHGFVAWAATMFASHMNRYVELLRLAEDDQKLTALERDAAAEGTLRAERLSRAIVDSVVHGIALVDEEGRVRLWNAHMERLSGVSATEAALERVTQMLHLDSAVGSELAESIAEAVAGRTATIDALRLPDQRVLGVIAQPFVDPVLGRKHALLMFHDETDRRRILERMLEMDRMISVGTLAAGVGHEINNPLAYVQINLDHVLEHFPSELTELRGVVEDAREGAERIASIVAQLKTMAGAGGPPELRGVPIGRVLDWALRNAQHELKHRARLEVDVDASIAVLGDETRIGQVLLNLLVNAAHAIPVGRADEHLVSVKSSTDGAFVRLTVSDTGSGIAPENVARIFDPFFTTKAPGEGTGLGLAITRRIVEEHGGTIEVESVPGSTKFTIALPIARVSHPPKQVPSRPAPVGRGQRLRVMVIDDEPMVLRGLRRILAQEHEVTTTTNASDLLDLLDAGERFGIVLCDVMMPTMSGVELHERLMRTHPEMAERTVFITGGAFTDETRAFVERMGERCIEKPLKANEVRAIVARFGRAEPRRSVSAPAHAP